MALLTIMDEIAVRAASGITGLKACYSAASSNVLDTHGIPLTIDDWPVGIVWADGGSLEAGNDESMLHAIELRIWVGATDIGYAYATVMPFVDRAVAHFRTDIDAHASATRVLMTGYRAVEVDEANGKPFLVLPIELEALELYPNTAYTV